MSAYPTLALLGLSHRVVALPFGLLESLPSPGNVAQDPTSPYGEAGPEGFGQCVNGGTYTRFEDALTSYNEGEWMIETGGEGVKYGKDGLTMTLDEGMTSTGGIVIASRSHWRSPLKVTVDMKTAGDSGIVNAVIFKGEGTTGDEIDLEITGDIFQLPIWKDGTRLKKEGSGKDIKQDLRHETTEDPASQYYYRYPTFNPKTWLTYELDWEPDLVLWTIDDNERVQFLRKSDRFPTGPLPIRLGPWATEPDQDWAGGKVDWSRNPHPKMQLRNLVVEGCKVD